MKKRKILVALLSLAGAACLPLGLTACDNATDNPNDMYTHTHNYSWVDNGDGTHKQHCSVSDCEVPDINVEIHVWYNDECEKCKAVKPYENPPEHSHVWSRNWESDDSHHWHECEMDGCPVDDDSQKDGYGAHNFIDGVCVCGKPMPHSHVWSWDWESDGAHHWHECEMDGCPVDDDSQKYGYGVHNFINGLCVCGKEDPDAPTEGLKYKLNADNASYSVTGINYTSYNKNIVIPAEYDGKPVTSIENSAFDSCREFPSITIPNSVTSIGNFAFHGCSSLTSIEIPSSVTSIGRDAFSGCSSLMSITIPDSVTCIHDATFLDCSSLTSITLPDSITIIGYNVFWGCDSLQFNEYDNACYLGNDTNEFVVLIKANNTSITSCTVHENTKVIYCYAFNDCSCITNIIIPNSVTNIGYEAFYGCSSLTSITIPNSVASIDRGIFGGCNSLERITLPFVGESKDETSFTHFGYFFGAVYSSGSSEYVPVSLKTVIITGGASIGYEAFRGCNSLTSVTIGNGVTNIGENAFLLCSGLTSIAIGNSVTSIGSASFSGCSSLTSITIPDNVTSIGDWAFSSCNSIASITIGNGVTNIGENAFLGCNSLARITIGNSVTNIGRYAFPSEFSSLKEIRYTGDVKSWCAINGLEYLMQYGYMDKLYIDGKKISEELIIPNGVTSIVDYAFYGCSSLTSVTISNDVTSIGDYAFYGCSSLTSVTISNDVTSIGDYAFYGCSSLTSVTIPNSVTSIGFGAFYGCSGLTSITFNGTKEQWNAISKGDYWTNSTGKYNITCTDGKLDKNGNEITE